MIHRVHHSARDLRRLDKQLNARVPEVDSVPMPQIPDDEASTSNADHHLHRQLGLRDLVLSQVLTVVGATMAGAKATGVFFPSGLNGTFV